MWGRLIVLLLTASLVGVQTSAGSTLPVLRLLGPTKHTVEEMRAEQGPLLAARERWLADPAARFLIDRRLAFNFYDLLAADSAYLFLHSARVAGAALPTTYGLDVSQVTERLANYHYRRAAYDSAYLYYLAQAGQVRASGRSLTDAAPAVLLEGPSEFWPGRALAQAYANAGLALRRSGDLAGPVKYYVRALRQFQAIRFGPGVVWAYELLGEAYEEQGNDRKAAAAYENALRTAQADFVSRPAHDRVSALEAISEALLYYEPQLLRLSRPDQLLAHAADGLAKGESVLAIEATTGRARDVLNTIATLRLLAAQAHVTAGQWNAATSTLDQAIDDLQHLAAVSVAVNRHELHYYEKQVKLYALRAILAHRQGAAAERGRALALARGYLDSLAYPSARLQTTFQLAAYHTQLGEYTAAVALLEPLVPQFRQVKNRPKLRDTYRLLAQAYAAQGRYAAAYHTRTQYDDLNDSLRAAQQYAALADIETRYQTQQKEAQIGQLTARSEQEQRQKQLAWAALALLAFGLGGVGWVLRNTRRLNRQLNQQRQLLEAQATELAVLDEAKSRFFANVSHELRTPLTLLVGPVEHLLGQAPSTWHPDAVRERLTMILRNGQRLQRLVNSILDLTKLAAGRLDAQLTPVPAVAFFGQLIDSFAGLAMERGLTLTSHLDLPLNLRLLLDTEKVEKITLNLLANALRFTPAGGSVVVTLTHSGPAYCLTVQDNGPGIAADEQARVFERFYQSRHRPVAGGTGLGLALSRELAELLGGTITLRSTLGEGCTFAFAFPAGAADEQGALSDSVPSEREAVISAPLLEEELPATFPHWNGRRPRLLVVEDDPDLRRYLHQILDPYYEVLEAADGQAALDVLARTEVELISSDAMMPGVDGIELLAHVKGHVQWRRRPFLMLTARTDLEHKLTALELGVDDYLPKPFLARELLARVRNLLANYYERRRWLTHPPAGPEAEPNEEATGDSAADTARNEPLPGAEATTAPAGATERLAAEPVVDEAYAAPLRQALDALIPGILTDPDYTPQALADALALSERTAYRRLKELTGLTPAGWLREVRLDRARQLFEARALPTVAEVAYAVGFLNPSYFTQMYSKRFGKKPSDY